MGRFIRALIVLHRTYGSRPIRDRLHTLIRFLTCPFLRVLPSVPNDARLLDIGAGHGVFAVLARDRGARVVAVEPDLRKVRPVAGIGFVAGYDPVVRGTFDAISIIDVLYRFPVAEWDALLQRCAERLRPGGVLLIKEQDPTSRFKSAWNRAQERLTDKVKLTLGEAFDYEPPRDFAARLERRGFAATWKRIDFGYPHAHVLYVAVRKP